MTANNPPTFDHIVELNGQNVKCAIIPIGTWNMDTTLNKNVALPASIDWSRVLSVYAMIVADGVPTTQFPLVQIDPASVANSGGNVAGVGSPNGVTLIRIVGGLFDNASFSSTASSRGNLHLWYY